MYAARIEIGFPTPGAGDDNKVYKIVSRREFVCVLVIVKLIVYGGKLHLSFRDTAKIRMKSNCLFPFMPGELK